MFIDKSCLNITVRPKHNLECEVINTQNKSMRLDGLEEFKIQCNEDRTSLNREH